jgi:NAD-dependent DNA ligase
VVDIVFKLTEMTGETISQRFQHNRLIREAAEWFKSPKTEADLTGLQWADAIIDPSFWPGKSVVITGDFDAYPDRSILAALLTERGAKVSSAISGKTAVVFVGRGAGPSKLDKVREMTVQGKTIICVSEELLQQIFEPTQQ